MITDYILPEMRGPELIAKLAERGLVLPVLFVSGYAPADDMSLDSRFCKFLQKPFHGDALLKAIRELLDA